MYKASIVMIRLLQLSLSPLLSHLEIEVAAVTKVNVLLQL